MHKATAVPAKRLDADGNHVRTVRLSVRIPEQLVLELRVLTCDPRTGRARYGRWGRTFEHILREWIDSQKAQAE